MPSIEDVKAEPHPFCVDCGSFEARSHGCTRAGGRKANIARLSPGHCGPQARLFRPRRATAPQPGSAR